MATQKQFLYLADPLTLQFETEVAQTVELPDGRQGVILTESYFYPTGGGQEHDTGTLGGVCVLDVVKSEGGTHTIHIVDTLPGKGRLQAQICRERRLRHMQHHTAQHLLSACFQQVLGLETISSAIHGDEPTTIDLPDSELPHATLNRVEDTANQIVFENRPVKSYFVHSAQIAAIPLRRPPKVSGEIRIVEIEGFDYAACGATHCPQTGMIGVIKIIRSERINQKTRIHFVAGLQALEYFRLYHETTTDLAADFSTHPSEVTALVRKQTVQLQASEKALRQLRLAYSHYEAQEMLAQAETIGGHSVLLRAFESRPADELRTLGNTLKAQPDLIAMLATFDGKKLALVVTCGTATGLSARDLLNQQLAGIGGRGGGDAQLAQGGGPITKDQFASLFTPPPSFLLP